MRLGLEALERLSDVGAGTDDAPLERIRVAKVGPTNAAGTHEALERPRQTAAEAARALEEEAAKLRYQVLHLKRAVREGEAAAGGVKA